MSIFIASAQSNNPLWIKISKSSAMQGKAATGKHKIIEESNYYELNTENMRSILANAANLKNPSTSNIIISVPNTQDDFEPFRIVESSILEPTFQASFPNIRTYEGESIKNPGTKIRLSMTPKGLHSMIMYANKSTEFIDPVSYGGKNYVVYKKTDLKNFTKDFTCHFIDNPSASKNQLSNKSSSAMNANDGILRSYDLALACTQEYANYHINANGYNGGNIDIKKDIVIAAMAVTMNRVNGIFKRDLSIEIIMINNRDIIFLSEPDGYDNTASNAMLDQNQSIIDTAIGSANYDIGHLFSTSFGGIAMLNSPCNNNNKAKGITGLENPVGDVFDVEFVAHEMGHQFGAPHTWSADSGSCDPASEWSASNAYEPGSGSTIMSYAGLCTPENVQTNGDDYFHQKSIQMIWTNITGGTSSVCDTETATGNTAPTANAGNNYSIPVSTPYKLTGSSMDADGTGSHTYTWEQFDLAPSQGSISESNTSGPLVRSYPPSSSPVRYIPNLEDLATSNGSTTWEKLASVNRSMNFQFTVRDNDSRGGQTDADGMVISIVNSNGPFQVTSQNDATLSYPKGSTQTITWDVANTDLNPINTSQVNIRLSTDGGLTYPTLLTTTANDGSADVTFPANIAAPYCRIMVEADPSENIFFAINKENFALGYTISTTCTVYEGGSNLPLPITDNSTEFSTSTIAVSESTTISDINVSVDINHTYKGDLQITLLSPQNSQTNLLTAGYCGAGSLNITFDDDANTLDCNNSENNETYKPVNPLSIFNGENPSGNWTLGIVDLAAEDTGTLESWSIKLCTTTISLSNTTFENTQKDLKVFPNPNHGEFTVTFKNSKASNVNLEIFDLRGRLIYIEQYTDVIDFNESINLNHLQSGMYILNISDGPRNSTKKIIIE
ncbi:T9SS type A sorting domain-containing protein [Gaetbulibacter saemankumensis]|uniref:T9SS type A sorting domain-containing protein n=1 Tax=Gaetbulibacter saemankumensis TaxID=311208 RepID=UPI0004066D69|nr:zinc-dependent metalloprotease family protein [Gaetbulibacter saemankumensis]